MVETQGHGWGLGFEWCAVIGEDFAIDFLQIAAEVFFRMQVEFEVDFSEGELAHENRGGHVVFGGDHFLEKIFGYAFTGDVVAGEEIEAFAFPAEIFHDLGGKLDEVPRDIGAGKGFYRYV